MSRKKQLAAFVVVLLVSLLGAAGSGAGIATGQPTRIVSLSPTATEMLYAIGAGKQIVAVDDQSNYPARAPRTKLSGFTPNVEAIAKYRPDLVVGEAGLSKLAGAFEAVGIPLLVEPSAPSLADAYGQIMQLGRATGHTPAAAALVKRMKAQIAAIVKSMPKGGKPLTVYHELDPTYYTATSKTFIGSVYRLFGFRDIADAAGGTGGGYPQLSAEYIIAQNPQIIVLADTKCCQQSYATVSARPGWSSIAAVEHHRVVGADDDVASRWGPRIVQFARSVARIAKQG
jgi:iron complex transport system substrate-binding protein